MCACAFEFAEDSRGPDPVAAVGGYAPAGGGGSDDLPRPSVLVRPDLTGMLDGSTHAALQDEANSGEGAAAFAANSDSRAVPWLLIALGVGLLYTRN